MCRAVAVALAVVGIIVVSAAGQMPPPAPPLPAGSNLLVGHVIDGATGAPVPTAIVTLRLDNAGGPQQSTERILTDSQGRFFFDSLGAGSFSLTATKPGWIDGASGRTRPGGPSSPVVLRDGEKPDDLSIPLWRYAVVSGRVVDELSDPLVGTEVRIFRGSVSAGRRHWTFVTRAITDDRGLYRFFQLLPGAYVVVVPAAVTTEPASFRSGNTVPDSYYQTMSPIGAAPMTLTAARMPIGSASLVTSIINVPRPSDDGAWVTYPTTFHPSSASITSASIVDAVSGRERASTDIVMRLVPTFTVSGTVTASAGMPAGSLAVHLLPADSAAGPLFDVATAVTDGSGAFTFHGVPAGQYIARIVRTPSPGEGWRFSTCGGTGAIPYVCSFMEKPTSGPPPMPTEPLLHAETPVGVTDGHVRGVVLELVPGARASGRVELEGSGARPAPDELRNVTVFLDPAGGQVFRAAGTSVETSQPGRIGDNGQFVMPSMWPGRYVLRLGNLPPKWSVRRATVQGRDVLDTPFVLASDVDNVVITLSDQTTQLSGTLQLPADQLDADVSVLLFPSDPAMWVDYGRSTRRIRMVSATGASYSTSSPPEGDYYIVALFDRQVADEWRDPAFLARAAALAERVTVSASRSMAQPLRVRSMQ